MANWDHVKLAECVDLLAGYAFKSARFTQNSDDIALVKGENVGQGQILWEIARRWPKSEWESLVRFQLKAADVILAMDRPWVPAGLKWAFVHDSAPKALLVQRCARLRSKEQMIDQTFLRFVIGSGAFEGYVRPITTGVNVPHISGKQILDYEFPLPPLDIQQKIASILASYDGLIEINQRRIRILEEMARSLYREWFVNFRFPGHENHPRISSSLGEIPQGWELKPVTNSVLINPKVAIPKDGEKPFVPMTSLSTDSMLISEIASRGGNSGSKFEVGDTLFARITPCLENGKTGFVTALPNNSHSGFGSTEFIVLRGRTVTPEYVYCLARSEAFREHAIKSMTGATGRQRVQEACFEQFYIAEPPVWLTEQFSEFAVPAFRLIHQLLGQIENLRKTRDLLLPRLLSGQIKLEAN